MINSIAIKNFKSFVDEEITLSSLTLLTGLNSSGKSSVIQALRMYNQAYNKKSSLLVGHGNLDEMRSKFSNVKSNIVVELAFDDNKDSLTINSTVVQKPNKGPVFMYVGADRLGPQPNLPIEQTLNTSPNVGEKGEYVLSFIHRLEEHGYLVPKELLQESSQSRTYMRVMQDWLSEITPGVSFNAKYFEAADTSHAEIDGFRPTNVGFGLSYTLPVIAAALGVIAQPPNEENNDYWVDEWERKKKNDGVLLVLENPEAHLHPKGQTAMGKLLALCAKQGAQILVETHSEHVMDGIRIAIKQGLISYTQINFHYFSKDEQGLSQVRTPKLDANAKLDSWPEGFFDQALKNRAILAKRS